LPSIHDAASPCLKSPLSEKELKELFTPTAEEFDLAHAVGHNTAMRIAFLALLKTFQRQRRKKLCSATNRTLP